MISKEDLAEVLRVAVRNGDFAEIYVERSSQNRVSMEAGKIERVISGSDEGAGIRVVRGENTAYGYTTELTKEGLLELARQVAVGVGDSEAQTGEKAPTEIVLEKRESPVLLPVSQRPDQVGIDKKVALVLEAEKAARAKDEKLIRQVSVGYADIIQQVVIANSDGVYVEDERVRSRLVVHVVASDGKVIQTGYDSAGATKGFELFAEEKAADLGRRAAERALLMLKARRAPAGRMAVVIS
ncbi:MAG: DNA gyrase modulator, partial [Thermacetogeniaceae bacterium]